MRPPCSRATTLPRPQTVSSTECSAQDDLKARTTFLSLRNRTSIWDGGETSLALFCSDPTAAAPAGVPSNLLDASAELQWTNAYGGEYPDWQVEPSYTHYWRLAVSTTTKMCPTFTAAFGSALAYAAQIEIIITVVLIFAAKKTKIIKDAANMVDMGGDTVIHAKDATRLLESLDKANSQARAASPLEPAPLQV